MADAAIEPPSDGGKTASGGRGGGGGEGTNIAAWLYGVEDIRLLPAPALSDLGPHDVRVKVKAVGICGSDVHFYKHMRIADFVVRAPMVIGHESAGVVSAVGAAVTRCKPGDAVALEPGRGCLAASGAACAHCGGGRGRYNLCQEMKFFATPPVHGSLANEIIHPDFLCFPLPPSVSLEEGAMCEPLSVAVHACRRALAAGPALLPFTNPTDPAAPSTTTTTAASTSSAAPASPYASEPSLSGLHVAVVGAGPIGLLVAMTARALGAAAVAIADVSDDRVAFAREVLGGGGKGSGGAEGCEVQVLQMEAGATGDSNAASLLKACGGIIHVTMDCVGITATMRTALHATSAGGRVVLIGMGETEPEMSLPIPSAVALREVDIVGVFRYCHTYDICVSLLKEKRVNVKPLITHRFGFSQEDVEAAFRVSAGGGKAVKVMFKL